MDRTPEVSSPEALLSNGSDAIDFLDHQDDDELDEFEHAQTRRKLQQKRRKAAGA